MPQLGISVTKEPEVDYFERLIDKANDVWENISMVGDL
jgi:hypothetical protein